MTGKLLSVKLSAGQHDSAFELLGGFCWPPRHASPCPHWHCMEGLHEIKKATAETAEKAARACISGALQCYNRPSQSSYRLKQRLNLAQAGKSWDAALGDSHGHTHNSLDNDENNCQGERSLWAPPWRTDIPFLPRADRQNCICQDSARLTFIHQTSGHAPLRMNSTTLGLFSKLWARYGYRLYYGT